MWFFHIQLNIKVFFIFNETSFSFSLVMYYVILGNISWTLILKDSHFSGFFSILTFFEYKKCGIFTFNSTFKFLVFKDIGFKLSLDMYYGIPRNVSWIVIFKRIAFSWIFSILTLFWTMIKNGIFTFNSTLKFFNF